MSKPLTVVAFGDSTTAAREGVIVYPDRLQQYWQARRRPVRVVNAGVRGDHTQGALARLEVDVLAHAPQIVIVRFGINDAAVDVWDTPRATAPRVPLATFLHNLCEIVARTREIGAIPLLCTPNPLAWHEMTVPLYGREPYRPDEADGFNVVLHAYVAAIREVAAALDVPLVDLDAGFRGHVSKHTPPWDALLLDGMHPNDAGHQLAATMLATVLEQFLPPP